MKCFTSMRTRFWTWSLLYRLKGISCHKHKSGPRTTTRSTISRDSRWWHQIPLPQMYITDRLMKTIMSRPLWMIRGFKEVECQCSMLLPIVRCLDRCFPWVKVLHIPASSGLSSALQSSRVGSIHKSYHTFLHVLFHLCSASSSVMTSSFHPHQQGPLPTVGSNVIVTQSNYLPNYQFRQWSQSQGVFFLQTKD